MSTAVLTAIGIPRTMTAWIKLILLIVSVVVGCWALSSFDYERYLSLASLTQRLHEAGPWAPLLLIASMACAVIVPPIPSLPLDLAAGAVFGPFYGALYAMIGAEIGAVAGFLIARAMGRETLSHLFKTKATFCQTCTDHQLMGAIFFARLIPIFSFEVVSFGAGFTNVSLKTFALATLFGMAPPTLAFTYLGSSIVSTQWSLIAAGAGMVLVFLVLPKILAKYRDSRFAHLFLGPPPPPLSATRWAEIPLQIRCFGCGRMIPRI
jgi:uncharacterized membrane protein YdjX (TVP38/TMEM64 family)